MQKVLSVVGDYLLGWLYVLVIFSNDQAPKDKKKDSSDPLVFHKNTLGIPTKLFLWGLGLGLLGTYIFIWFYRGDGAAALYGAIITLIAIGILSMVKIR